MFDLKGADGNPLFNTLRVGLSCEKCQRDGKAESCTHMKDVIRKLIYLFCLQLNLILTISLAPWKSAAKFVSIYRIQLQLYALLTFFKGHGSCHIW